MCCSINNSKRFDGFPDASKEEGSRDNLFGAIELERALDHFQIVASRCFYSSVISPKTFIKSRSSLWSLFVSGKQQLSEVANDWFNHHNNQIIRVI